MSISWYYLLVISLIPGSLCPVGAVLDLELRLGPPGRERPQEPLASAQTVPRLHDQSSSRDGQAADVVPVQRSEPLFTHVRPGQENISRTPTAQSAKRKAAADSSPDSQFRTPKRLSAAPSEEDAAQAMSLDNTISVRPVTPPIDPVAAPEVTPRPLQIISLAPLEAKGVPKVAPFYSWKKKVTILCVSLVYGRTFSAGTHEMLAFKNECSKLEKFPTISKMATTIQKIMNSITIAFGTDMPVHPLFSNYGDRVFPELVAMHMKGIDEKEIFKSQKYLLNKWVYHIDYIRFHNRKTPYKLFLTYEPAIELLDAMIRANWDVITVDNFLGDLFTFSRNRVGKKNTIALEEALGRLDWFTEEFVSTVTRVALSKQTNVDEIQKTFDILVDEKEAYTVHFEEPELANASIEEPNDAQGLEESSAKKFTGTVQEVGTWRWEDFLIGLVETVRNTSKKTESSVEGLKRSYWRQLNDESSDVPSTLTSTGTRESLSRSKSTVATDVELSQSVIKAKLQEIEVALAEGKLDSSDTEFFEHSAWDPKSTEIYHLKIPRQHINRFCQARDCGRLESKELRQFLSLLSSRADDKMTEYSFIKLCEVFNLAPVVWKDQDGVKILLAELLPMLILGNNPIIPKKVLRYKPTMRRLIEYVYLDFDDDPRMKERWYIKVKEALLEFKRKAKF